MTPARGFFFFTRFLGSVGVSKHYPTPWLNDPGSILEAKQIVHSSDPSKITSTGVEKYSKEYKGPKYTG
jgi:hypothetical protein